MRRRAAALIVPLLVFMSACGGDAEPNATESSNSDSAVPTVTGAFGEAPTVELPDSDPGDELVVDVLEKGDGAETAEGEVVVANYLGQRWAAAGETASESADPSASASAEPTDDGATDDVFDSTFVEGGTPISFPLQSDSLLPGMLEGLVGQTVGSRILVVIPPEDGFGPDGAPDLGIAPEDSLVFIFDVLDVFGADAAAEGTPVEQTADPALPTVADGEGGPQVTVPSASTPPTELVTQTLIEGDGTEVLAGQFLVVQYRGVLWKDGSEFDASWTRGAPTGFPIGVGGVIPGWDTGLVGQSIGSRVLLVVPPAEGYGEAGSPPKIAGTDTLVFVVDILGAYGDPA